MNVIWEPIVFFDLETTGPDQGRMLLEFGSILVCPRRLIEIESYSTLIQPDDPSFWDFFKDRSNGITREVIASAPHFSQVADTIYGILNGRIWAGHNIQRFDCDRIHEAFADIGQPAPSYKLLIDSLTLLTKWFGKRAGDMKLDSLAEYFGFEQQVHRSLSDVRMNIEVFKHCGAVLFLESMFPDVLPETSWITPYEVSIPSTSAIPASFYEGNPKIRIMHNDIDLKLRCSGLKVCLGIKMFDGANGRRLTFVVDASSRLCDVLDKCDDLCEEKYRDCGGDSEWYPVVNRKFQTVRLRLNSTVDGDIVRWNTQIERDRIGSSTIQRVLHSKFECAELESLFIPGTFVDAFISLDMYDYQKKAGIGLVADRLIIRRS